MKIPRQTKNAYDPDFASFKILVRLCARSRTLMKRPVQTKMRYDPDFGSFDLWKDSERPKKFMIQTLARSIYEKKGAKTYRQKWRKKRRYFLVSSVLLLWSVGFFGFVEVIRIGCEKRRIIKIASLKLGSVDLCNKVIVLSSL